MSKANEFNEKQFIQQGWECPKCGAILAPNQNYCPFCSPSEYGRSNWLIKRVGRIVIYKADYIDKNCKSIKDDKYTIEIYDDYRE